MAKRVKITFVSNPTPTVNLVLAISYPPYSNTIGVTIGTTISIGATKEDTASNLYDHYTGLVFSSWLSDMLTITLLSNVVQLDFEPEDDANLFFLL